MALRLSDDNKQQLEFFSNRPVEKLVRKDLGIAGFETIQLALTRIVTEFRELLSIAETYDDVPIQMEDALLYYIGEFNQLSSRIINFSVDDQGSVGEKQRIISDIKAFYDYLLTGMSRGVNYAKMPYSTLYLRLKQHSLREFKSQISQINEERTQLEGLRHQTNTLLKSLQDKAKEVSLHDYAQVFSRQARIHSSRGQKWLITSIIFALIFIGFICFIDRLFPIKTDGVNATVITIEYITRVLIVSFQIYVITFCAKQFNIQQHLATVNKHRENTLNSYKLFIDSLGDADTAIKPALMMEVAKAIYESGQTGYLGANDKSDSSPSMIELTKYISNNK